VISVVIQEKQEFVIGHRDIASLLQAPTIGFDEFRPLKIRQVLTKSARRTLDRRLANYWLSYGENITAAGQQAQLLSIHSGSKLRGE
jgi:hypothetical protein